MANRTPSIKTSTGLHLTEWTTIEMKDTPLSVLIQYLPDEHAVNCWRAIHDCTLPQEDTTWKIISNGMYGTKIEVYQKRG